MSDIETARAMVADVRARYPSLNRDTWRADLRHDYPGLLECEVSIGVGWGWLLRALIEHLATVDRLPKQFSQIKEKFGGICTYFCNPDIGEAYAALSYLTCEECGEPGVLRQGGWARTLCDVHAEGRGPRGRG